MFVVCLAASLAVALARGTGVAENANLRLVDAAFQVRHSLGKSPPRADIALVQVDSKSLGEIREPLALWSPLWAEVITKTAESGAVAVVPDLLWQFDPSLLSELGQAYEGLALTTTEAELKLGMTVLEYPVLVGFQRVGKELKRPRPTLSAAAGGRVAMLNVQQDNDGVLRRSYLFLSGEEGQDFSCLGMAAAETATGQTYDTAQPASWNGKQLPLYQDKLLINFCGPAGSFPVYSFVDVLRGRVDPAQLEGRVVFIGISDPTLHDIVRTPFSAGSPDTPGMEVHAHLTNTLLTGRFLKQAPAVVNLLAVVVLGLAAGWMAWRWLPLHTILAGVGLCLLWLLIFGAVFVGAGVILEGLGPLLAVPLCMLASYGLRSQTLEKERGQLRSTFGRMVAKNVLNALLADPDKLMSRNERRITVFFADINNFTPICEQLTPNEIIDLLNEYFQSMVEIMMRHEGYIKQYVGDEIMVIFGAPDDQPDHAVRAVRAAVEVQEMLAEKARVNQGKLGFYDVKSGVNTGDVVVGKVGPDERWEYAAVGDDVNLAARIMSTTKKLDCKLLISQKTKAEAEAHLPEFEWISRGAQNFKGKTEEIEVFEVRRKDPDGGTGSSKPEGEKPL